MNTNSTLALVNSTPRRNRTYSL